MRYINSGQLRDFVSYLPLAGVESLFCDLVFIQFYPSL